MTPQDKTKRSREHYRKAYLDLHEKLFKVVRYVERADKRITREDFLASKHPFVTMQQWTTFRAGYLTGQLDLQEKILRWLKKEVKK